MCIGVELFLGLVFGVRYNQVAAFAKTMWMIFFNLLQITRQFIDFKRTDNNRNINKFYFHLNRINLPIVHLFCVFENESETKAIFIIEQKLKQMITIQIQ